MMCVCVAVNTGLELTFSLWFCVRLLSVFWVAFDVCIVAKWCALEYKLLLTACRDSYTRNRLTPKRMTLTLFRGRLRSCQTLHHIRYWLSRKPLEIEAWFQRTTNRKWCMRNRMVTWPMTSRDPERWSSRDPSTLKAQYLQNNCKCYLSNNRQILPFPTDWRSSLQEAHTTVWACDITVWLHTRSTRALSIA